LEQDIVDRKTALQTAIYKPIIFGELGPQMVKMGPEFRSSQNQLFRRSYLISGDIIQQNIIDT